MDHEFLLVAACALAGTAASALAWKASTEWIAAWSPGSRTSSWAALATLAGFGAAVGALAGWRHDGDMPALAPLAACGPVLLFLLATDFRVRRIPSAGAALLAIAGLAVAPLAGSDAWREQIGGSFLGLAAAGMLWAAGRIFGRRSEVAFGGGDVLLAAGIGAAVGFSRTFAVLLAGATCAAISAMAAIARGEQGPLPWGAFLCAAAVIALAW